MSRKLKILNALLAALLFFGSPTPSSGFGMMKGGGGGGGSSGVAEILAAGLITSMLMESKPKSIPMIHHILSHHLIAGYHAMPPRHPMQPLFAGRIPMMNPYVQPIMPRQRYNMMNQALMSEVSKQQALASRLNEEIQVLQEHESMLEAAIARAREGSEKAISELLEEEENDDDETIPAAALLLETAELMSPRSVLENSHPLPPPDMFETAASEPESRYLLPRIVKHFVQRLMRRAEHH